MEQAGDEKNSHILTRRGHEGNAGKHPQRETQRVMNAHKDSERKRR